MNSPSQGQCSVSDVGILHRCCALFSGMVHLEMYGRSEPGFKDVFFQAACDAISTAVGVGAGQEDEGPRLRCALARSGAERKEKRCGANGLQSTDSLPYIEIGPV